MNSKKNYLPPSPRSCHARKPIIDIANLQSYSLERKKTLEKDSSLNNSLDRKKLNQTSKMHVRFQDNSVQNQQTNIIYCKNHKNRIAISFIERRKIQYFCFQCTLYEARNGYKTKAIKLNQNTLAKQEQALRQKQIQQYLKTADQTSKNYQLYSKQVKQSFFKHIQGLEIMIMNYNSQLEEQIRTLQQIYYKKKEQIQRIRQQHIRAIKPYLEEIEHKCNILSCNRLDVINNFQECIHFFTPKQYENVMTKYWKQIQSIKQQIKHNQLTTLIQNFKSQVNCLLNTPQSTKVDEREFTFSKSNKFQTPKQDLKFTAISMINSNSKSLKASPKDKINISPTKKSNYLVSSFGFS